MQNLSRWRCEPPSTVPMAINASTLLLEAQGLRCRAPGKCTSCGMHMARPNALILDDVSLAVAAGERIGLTGVSGSGKSTLLRALLALQPLDTGSLKVAGRPVEPGPVRSLRWFRRTVQYVPQSPAATLDPRRTVEQSLLEPMIALGCSGGASARISALLDDVELPSSLLKRTAGTLSGGQAQRVVIARALALSPRLLLADEPTSGLDLATRDVLMTLLERLMKTHGMALMMVTHDIGAMAGLCMRGIVMSRGRIVEDSPMMALLKQPQHEETRALMHCAHITGMAPLHRHVPQPMSSS